MWKTLTLASILVLVVAACGERGPAADALRELPEGTLQGEVLRALGPGPLPETVEGWTVEYGYRAESFFIDGESWRVVYATDAAFTPADSMDATRQTPVILRNGELHAWGWPAFDEAHRSIGLPLPAARAGQAEEGDQREAMAEAFWNNLTAHCGQAFPGELTLEPEGDDMLDGDELLIVHFRACSERELQLPFHIALDGGESWDRSRTWIFRNRGDGVLELRHDHRLPDGSEAEVTWYGGYTVAEGTQYLQEFIYDEEEYPDRADRGWRIEIVPGNRYSYGTIRAGEWTWRVDFDLSTPLSEPPPAPWGY